MSTREVGWAAIKAKLKGFGASELMALVRDLSLERVLESVVRALPSVPESARPTIVERLRQLAKRAESTGWGYGDAVREITMAVVWPRAERRPLRRARRS